MPRWAPEDSETQLHRQVVEVRDAVIDPRVSFELTDRERSLIDEAEAHLLGHERRNAPAQTLAYRVAGGALRGLVARRRRLPLLRPLSAGMGLVIARRLTAPPAGR